MTKILIVEDETSIAELIKYNLESSGYSAECEVNGERALERIIDEMPDLVILDLMLPGMDGLNICRLIRQNEKTRLLPVIFVTAKDEEIDRVLGLELGADDYITKPFSPRELVTRVKALLRRAYPSPQTVSENKDIISRGNLIIYPERYEAAIMSEILDLTPREFKLLLYLATHEGKVITRERLLESVWGYDYDGESRTIDVHIRHLRYKIEKEAGNVCIDTLRGIGYRFRVLNR